MYPIIALFCYALIEFASVQSENGCEGCWFVGDIACCWYRTQHSTREVRCCYRYVSVITDIDLGTCRTPLHRHLAVADDMQTILEAKYNHGEHRFSPKPTVGNSYEPLKSIYKVSCNISVCLY